jgi:hypothetical protein
MIPGSIHISYQSQQALVGAARRLLALVRLTNLQFYVKVINMGDQEMVVDPPAWTSMKNIVYYVRVVPVY